MNDHVRAYKLEAGDIIFICKDNVRAMNLQVIEKTKNPNRKWFQLWKPRWVGYRFIAQY